MQEIMKDVLGSNGPNKEYASKLMLYGQFVGSWEGHVIVHRSDGTKREESCEVLFGWVLDGKAIQDVWIAPARKDRIQEGRSTEKDIFGTTLRIFNPKTDQWEIHWIEPNTQSYEYLTGKQVGDDIVNEYKSEEGQINQWMFTEITKDTFHWIGRESNDNKKTWKIRNEFFLKRIN